MVKAIEPILNRDHERPCSCSSHAIAAYWFFRSVRIRLGSIRKSALCRCSSFVISSFFFLLLLLLHSSKRYCKVFTTTATRVCDNKLAECPKHPDHIGGIGRWPIRGGQCHFVVNQPFVRPVRRCLHIVGACPVGFFVFRFFLGFFLRSYA